MSKNQPLVTVSYTLADGEVIQVEVTEAVALVLKTSDLKTLSLEKQDKRNLELRELEQCEDKLLYPPEHLIDLVIRRDGYGRLYQAMEHITATQRRRLEAHFFDGLSYRKIAEIEDVDHKCVFRSVHAALVTLKNILG